MKVVTIFFKSVLVFMKTLTPPHPTEMIYYNIIIIFVFCSLGTTYL